MDPNVIKNAWFGRVQTVGREDYSTGKMISDDDHTTIFQIVKTEFPHLFRSEDFVRPPDEVKVEQLVDTYYHDRSIPFYRLRAPGIGNIQNRGNEQPTNIRNLEQRYDNSKYNTTDILSSSLPAPITRSTMSIEVIDETYDLPDYIDKHMMVDVFENVRKCDTIDKVRQTFLNILKVDSDLFMDQRKIVMWFHDLTYNDMTVKSYLNTGDLKSIKVLASLYINSVKSRTE